MRYVSLFLLLFVASTSVAQIIKDKEPAILEVHYIPVGGIKGIQLL